VGAAVLGVTVLGVTVLGTAIGGTGIGCAAAETAAGTGRAGAPCLSALGRQPAASSTAHSAPAAARRFACMTFRRLSRTASLRVLGTVAR
jgi:hypothetical protein